MKWQILVDGRPVEIDPLRLGDVIEVEPGVYSVLSGGVPYEIRVLESEEGWQAEAEGRRFNVEIRDPRDFKKGARAAHGSGTHSISAPMPGKVVRVLVHPGDEVEAGQGLVVVEAMKMQNEMKAARAARVLEVGVQAGETVGAGDTLVVLEYILGE